MDLLRRNYAIFQYDYKTAPTQAYGRQLALLHLEPLNLYLATKVQDRGAVVPKYRHIAQASAQRPPSVISDFRIAAHFLTADILGRMAVCCGVM